MVENLIYTRLSSHTALTDLVGERIYPTTPTVNTQLPFVVYSRSASAPQLHTTGASNLTQHTIEIAVHAVDLSTVTAILSAVKGCLHAYRGGQIQGSFLQTQACQEEEYGHYGLATYSVWETTTNVTATVDSTGLISTGPDRVTLAACDHTLTLDCDGLLLDGEAVVPDLSGYAVLSGGNAFSGMQVIRQTGGVAGTDEIRISHDGTRAIVESKDGGVQFKAPYEAAFDFVSGGGNNHVHMHDLTLTNGISLGDYQTQIGKAATGTVQIISYEAGSDGLGRLVCGSGVAGKVAFTVQGASSQSANLTEWKNSTGNVLANVTPSGSIQLRSTSGTLTGSVIPDFVGQGGCALQSAARLDLRANGIIYLGCLDSGNHRIEGQDGFGAVAFKLYTDWRTSTLRFLAGQYATGGPGETASTGTYSAIQCGAPHPSVVGLTVQGAPSQTASLQEWKNSGGSVLASVTANGGFSPASMADASAANNTLYYSTDASKLVYKDAGGAVNNLY